MVTYMVLLILLSYSGYNVHLHANFYSSELVALIWSFSSFCHSDDSIIAIMSWHVIFVASSSDSCDRRNLWTIRLPTPSSIRMSHTCGDMSVLSLVEGSGFALWSGIYVASSSDTRCLSWGGCTPSGATTSPLARSSALADVTRG